jgi:energy-coupling factor transporter ATP-binding protein EcfA2
MSAKILINGKAGSGKSTLLKDLKDAFVISRDGKAFPFRMPHMLVPQFHSMDILMHGGEVKVDDEEIEVEGFFSKMERFEEKTGKFPDTVAIDSVSKVMQDIIDYANLNFTNFDIHSHVNKEVAKLTKFVQEDLVANGINVVLVNHVMDNDKKGLIPVGQGKFKDKGGFYSEVDHAILVDSMKITHRGVSNQARTTINELPDNQYTENCVNPLKSKKLKEGEYYYNLQNHIDAILKVEGDNAEWSY